MKQMFMCEDGVCGEITEYDYPWYIELMDGECMCGYTGIMRNVTNL